MANRPGSDAAQINANLRQSVAHARSLGFAVAGFSGQLNGAVNASAAIAENIAKASRNASIAASATGIGAVVAVIGTIAAATINWRNETKEVANKVREIGIETKRLEASAAGNKRLEKELEIQGAMEGELESARKMEHFYRKFPELQDAIRRKAQAARDALKADTERSFSDRLFDLDRNTNVLPAGGTELQREYARRQADIQAERAAQLRAVERNTEGYNPDQIDRIRERIQLQFEGEMRQLRYDMDAPARHLGDALGRSITESITNGITNAIKNRSFADGFRSLTGGILIGFGNMMQEIGTQSLLAAQLLKKVIDAFRSFAPEGAIVASLALIAGGAVLKGIGASMQGGGGGGSGGGGGGVARVALTAGLVTVGPTPSAAAGSLAAGGPVFNHITVIGANDPVAQREILRLVDNGRFRQGKGR